MQYEARLLFSKSYSVHDSTMLRLLIPTSSKHTYMRQENTSRKAAQCLVACRLVSQRNTAKRRTRSAIAKRTRQKRMLQEGVYQQKNLYTFFHLGHFFFSSRSSSINTWIFSSRMPVTRSILCERTTEVRNQNL
jgi:hypothetical protein